MPEMISRKHHRYAGREVAPGEHFKAEARHVAFLIASGRAEYAERQMGSDEPQNYRTREMRSRKTRRS